VKDIIFYAEYGVEGVILKRRLSTIRRILLFSLVLLIPTGCATKDYRTASRESAGIAPLPAANMQKQKLNEIALPFRTLLRSFDTILDKITLR
jgi:hypothetical protein